MKAFLSLCILFAVVGTVFADDLLVQLNTGKIRGAYGQNGYSRVWRGVPFATPPLGNLRWTPPQPHANWTGVMNTTEDGPGCIQSCDLPATGGCPPVQSEDCLVLNVFSPRVVNTPAPVLVFWHGGNFRQGFGGGVLFDGSYIVNVTNLIVVSMQYRLGVLGFMHNSKADVEGNYGIQDQQLGLRWIRDNIAGFGGDPNSVTIWGQSAGAASVGVHLQSPASQGLFHAGILESDFALPFRTPDSWDTVSAALAKNINCDVSDLACFRNTSAETLLAGQVKVKHDIFTDLSKVLDLFLPFTPTIDTELVPLAPIDAFKAGKVANVPIIMGNTAQEAVIFIYTGFTKKLPKLEFDALMGVIFGVEKAIKIGQVYPQPENVTTRDHFAKIITEGVFICANRNATRTIANRGNVWYYVFDHILSFAPYFWGTAYPYTVCYDVNCHACDLPFTWGVTNLGPNHANATAAENNLSAQFASYFTNFAHNGDPNSPPKDAGSKGPQSTDFAPFPPAKLDWPAYSLEGAESMRMHTPLILDKNLLESHCDFWDTEIGYDFP